MQGMLMGHHAIEDALISKRAFELADAMIAERKSCLTESM